MLANLEVIMDISSGPHKTQSTISVVHGNILDVQSDYFISSGNPWLNMSGGVNGALRERYGNILQEELHSHLREIGLKAVPGGYCYRWKQPIGTYKGVVYAVGIDPFYDSSKELISQTLMTAIQMLQPQNSEAVVFPAIGTGYGHLTKADFGNALKELFGELSHKYPNTRFQLADRDMHEVEEFRKLLQ